MKRYKNSLQNEENKNMFDEGWYDYEEEPYEDWIPLCPEDLYGYDLGCGLNAFIELSYVNRPPDDPFEEENLRAYEEDQEAMLDAFLRENPDWKEGDPTPWDIPDTTDYSRFIPPTPEEVMLQPDRKMTDKEIAYWRMWAEPREVGGEYGGLSNCVSGDTAIMVGKYGRKVEVPWVIVADKFSISGIDHLIIQSETLAYAIPKSEKF